MSIHEFIEPIPVETPLGSGRAIFIESTPHDTYWTIAMDDNCALVTFVQNKLRIHRSYTHERCISNAEMKKIISLGEQDEE
jgi:hypothetical protein